jgi:AraC-like DNA-binding protein
MERMLRARTLSRNRSLQITDISRMVGYQTLSAFAASFRRETGETPSDFRRQLCGHRLRRSCRSHQDGFVLGQLQRLERSEQSCTAGKTPASGDLAST